MANTYTLIASSTVGATAVSSIDFTSIPQTYTDLKLVFSIRNNRNNAGPGYGRLQFNSSASNWSGKRLGNEDGSAFSSSRSDNYTIFSTAIAYATANTFGNGEVYIPNYTSSNYKSLSIDSTNETNAATPIEQELNAFLWSNTAAITSITISADAGTFLQYSTAYLYGIKNS